MTKLTHIISDLHLDEQNTHLFSLFNHYMQQIAPLSERLYVLGDLFEVWIGDDCLEEEHSGKNNFANAIAKKVIALLKNYSKNDGELFFIHGNRDFLLGQSFEKKTGGKILNEPVIMNLHGEKTALIHGDSLCTDDKDYQVFRNMVRNQQWQSQFLALSLQQRKKIAADFRQNSQSAKEYKNETILDVNEKSVHHFFRQHKIKRLIHGHTHRQASHPFKLNGDKVKRIVLSDWNRKGFYLSVKENHLEEKYFSI